MTWPMSARRVTGFGRFVGALLLLAAMSFPVFAKDDRSAAERALQAGLAAQKAGRHALAVRNFSQAIASGQLQRGRMAYALFRRALSNRAAKRSAQAISDVNSALFLKGELSERDRAEAVELRVNAYRDVGLKPSALAGGIGARDESRWAVTAQPATDASAQGADKSSLSVTGSVYNMPGFVTRVTKLPAAARSGSPIGPVGSAPKTFKTVVRPARGLGEHVGATTKSVPEQGRASVRSGSKSVGSGAVSGVSKFFSGLFGNGARTNAED